MSAIAARKTGEWPDLSHLSAADRRAVHNALTSSAIEGYDADPDAVALLADFANGDISIEEYQARVMAKAASIRR